MVNFSIDENLIEYLKIIGFERKQVVKNDLRKIYLIHDSELQARVNLDDKILTLLDAYGKVLKNYSEISSKELDNQINIHSKI